MSIADTFGQIVGNTPLFEVKNIEKEENLYGRVCVKLEYLNPTGSIKDRASLFMLARAEERGIITDGATIIEATSGNTGIGLAAMGASKGYKVILTMPDTMSAERIKLLKAYGTQIVLTEGKLGMQGAIDKAEEIAKSTPNSFIPSQFSNKDNIEAHYLTTGREILIDSNWSVDYVVAGIGSGGTISGIGKYLKEQLPNVKIIGFEPESSPLITKGKASAHKLQGIGANFIPSNYDASVVDEVVTVSDEEAYKYANMLAKKQGFLVGITSGASLAVAVRLAKKPENKGKIIVAIMADSGDRYLSGDLFE